MVIAIGLMYSASYMSQTRDQKHVVVSEVAADLHDLHDLHTTAHYPTFGFMRR